MERTGASTIHELIDHIDGPILFILRGLPGSGKTTQARLLNQWLGEEKSILLDPDYVEKTDQSYIKFSSSLRSAEPDLALEVYPYRFLLSQALNGLVNQKVVIWSQPFSDLEQLDYTINKLRKDLKRDFQTLIVDVETPVDIARQRNNSRIEKGGHGPNSVKFEEFVRRYTSARSLNHNWVAVDGTKDPEELLIAILASISEK